MTILDYIPEARPQGKEHGAPCPACGGDDRLRIWIDDKTPSGRYWCRQCGVSGDAIRWLMDWEDMTFPEACEATGQTHKLDTTGAQRRVRKARRKRQQPSGRPKAEQRLLEIERARQYWTEGERQEYAHVCRMMRERRREGHPTAVHEEMIGHLVQRAISRPRAKEDAVRRAECST